MSLNCGSSSVKYALFEMPEKVELCRGIVGRVTLGDTYIEHFKAGHEKYVRHFECPTYRAAIGLILEILTNSETGVIRTLSEIKAIGHRVVHGGEWFTKPVIINNKVIEKIEECSELAPLHNPTNLAGIKAIVNVVPNMLQVAVFDTAFFVTMLPHVFVYGLPYEWYQKYHVRRYGFHGTSHRYVSIRATALLGKKMNEVNLITLHIGNGVSISAIKGGRAYDHSMGFTPLEGAIMATRCGDVDPGILLYIMSRENLGWREMEKILNTKSGLQGVSGKYSDRRDIIKAMEAGDERAKLSFDIECYRLRKYIGAYAAGMGGVDAIVFTGGVGENSALHRQKICSELGFLGIRLNREKNRQTEGIQKEMEISSYSSPVKIFVIPTDEEGIIAEDVFAIIQNNG
jgi:acetate kinase